VTQYVLPFAIGVPAAVELKIKSRRSGALTDEEFQAKKAKDPLPDLKGLPIT
jgi:hypothetical protein